ncbi:MAG TPA: hypothetical protein VKK79_09880 [Candidatus Lokiarchaeia archaeon]|nr:hypothetical protein [Candidatus Lokiarchaeia archaeon]
MDPNTIILYGAGSYYTAWKQKFVDLIRAKFDAKIEYQANNLRIIGDEHAIDLKMDHNDSDVHIQITTIHNHRSWMFRSF